MNNWPESMTRHNLVVPSTASEPYPFPNPTIDEIRGINRKYNDPLNLKYLIECSIVEDATNSQYSGILNTLSNHCVGTTPIPMALTDSDKLNDAIEDRWIEICKYNGIGASLRELRRKAAQSGMAIMIPYKSHSEYDLKLAFKVVGQEHFESPYNPRDIVNGIEYWPTGEIKAVYIREEGKRDPTRYLSSPGKKGEPWGIVWFRKARPFPGNPECGPAFQVYPSINRFLSNTMREGEFKSAMPMAVELDPAHYRPNSNTPPKGAFKYEPGMIPTLPPGTRLTGLALQTMAEDRSKFVDLLVSVGARCIDMPKILALGSSSDSNMATAHIDLQPWKYVVDIDRFDFEIAEIRAFYLWYDMVSLTTMMPTAAFDNPRPLILFNYSVLFNHPDPLKNASARSIDLISGGSTLTRIYTDQGYSARREIEKEIKLLGITKEKFYELLLASRSKQSGEIINPNAQEDESENKTNQERSRQTSS